MLGGRRELRYVHLVNIYLVPSDYPNIYLLVPPIINDTHHKIVDIWRYVISLSLLAHAATVAMLLIVFEDFVQLLVVCGWVSVLPGKALCI
jgi:hypothetical protein